VKLFIIVLFITLSYSCTALDVVRYVHSEKYPDSKDRYFIDLLALALESTKTEFGDYKLQPVTIEMAQERTSKMLARNEYIDLTWRMTSKALEDQLQAVYFPLLKGLMGYRIFIIRQDEQSLFPKDLSLADLQKITAGQGYNWPDTKILMANGFQLIEGYDIYLLKMLEKKRFDYFPRALHEPWLEIDGNENVTVEKNILLTYRSPIYFFVNNSNKRLANRLNIGLKRLLDSGGFDDFFKSNSLFSDILEKSNLSKRKVFKLHNPLMSEKTKALILDERLWLKLL
jgi:hypothetical protein